MTACPHRPGLRAFVVPPGSFALRWLAGHGHRAQWLPKASAQREQGRARSVVTSWGEASHRCYGWRREPSCSQRWLLWEDLWGEYGFTQTCVPFFPLMVRPLSTPNPAGQGVVVCRAGQTELRRQRCPPSEGPPLQSAGLCSHGCLLRQQARREGLTLHPAERPGVFRDPRHSEPMKAGDKCRAPSRLPTDRAKPGLDRKCRRRYNLR